jgi:ligand-binding SRPBCC domain-containing protein
VPAEENMKIYQLNREQWIPRPLPVVFNFFARAENLGRITPPWLHFRVHTPLLTEMRAGAHIDYTIRLAGLPLRWRTRITAWEPERRFVDVQESGPYALWEHTHEFSSHTAGVLVADRVRYALPFGALGRAAHALAVRAALAAIFDFRYEQIGALLGADRGCNGRSGDRNHERGSWEVR